MALIASGCARQDDVQWWTAYHAACSQGHLDCVSVLVSAGCDTAALDRQGQTGSKIAASRGHANVVAWLRKLILLRLNAEQSETKTAQVAETTAAVGAAVSASLSTRQNTDWPSTS